MEQYRISEQSHRINSMGLTKAHGGIHFSVAAEGNVCRVLLYRDGEDKWSQAFSFPVSQKLGDVWSMTLLGNDFTGISYTFEIDGREFSDPYGKQFTGRETWGDLEAVEHPMRTPVDFTEFDWEGDQCLKIPYEDSVIYHMHIRGLTRHTSSKSKYKGTFQGVLDKLPYLKDLGITALELMPVNEFQEVMMPESVEGNPYGVDKPTGKINYWGYAPSCLFAPKSSYSSESDSVKEFKTLVKEVHKAGMELIIELYFTGKELPSLALEAVRYWVWEFHVDGIHLVGAPPLSLLGSDPYLSGTKLFATSWEGVTPKGQKHLAEYNDGFLVDMRRVLKGDEDAMSPLVFRSRHNPKEYGVINYIANTNGFTMMDMVSYDTKHNEANGEHNQDGNAYNYSWNCGVEGPTRRKKVVELRKKQMRNSFLLLFLSQGTPLLLSGDEFGNSQKGNNNAYCQDNEISWLNWNQLKTNKDIYEFAKRVIAFRKEHPVFHMAEEPMIMDYLACGQPDVSYHGVKAWCPEFENFRRQLGIMYCGEYGKKADGTFDNSFYTAYNMHWEPHEFDLPNLSKGKKWSVVFNTDAAEVNGMYEEGKGPVTKTKRLLVPARTIVVLMG